MNPSKKSEANQVEKASGQGRGNFNSQQPLVDCHHHFWALDALYYPWLTDRPVDFFLGDYSSIQRTLLPEDLLNEIPDEYRLLGTVHCEAEAERSQCVAETEWISSLSAQGGLPSAHIGWAPFGQDNCEAVLDAHCHSSLFRGVRAKPRTANRPDQVDALRGATGTLQDSSWLTGLKHLQARRLSWDLRVPAWHLAEAAHALESIPELVVVINHTGLPWDRTENGLSVWRKGMEMLALNPNVCVKLSELGTPWQAWDSEQNLALLCETLAIFGPQRCLYASNFPVSGIQVGYADWLALVEEAIGRTFPRYRDEILWRNACRWYRLSF